MSKDALVTIRASSSLDHPLATQDPPSIYSWLERAIAPGFGIPFPSLDAVLNVPLSPALQSACEQFFPRISRLSKYLLVFHATVLPPEKQVEAISEAGITPCMLETLPDAVITILKDGVVKCQANPPTTWSSPLLELIDREDLILLAKASQPRPRETLARSVSANCCMK